MANFWTSDIKSLGLTLGNQKPLDIAVRLVAELIDSNNVVVASTPEQIITVPASGQKGISFSIDFSALTDGMYTPVVIISDLNTNAVIAKATGEKAWIYSKILNIVNVTWV